MFTLQTVRTMLVGGLIAAGAVVSAAGAASAAEPGSYLSGVNPNASIGTASADPSTREGSVTDAPDGTRIWAAAPADQIWW